MINLVMLAAQGDQPSTLYYHLKNGIDVNEVDKKQSTALHWAAYSGSELAMHYILAFGPRIDEKDLEGFTPLHISVKMAEEFGHTRIIRFLLVKGASRSSKDN